MGTYTKLYFRPDKGEQIITTITPGTIDHSAICGRVIDSKGVPIKDALVLLFRVQEEDAAELISQCCTDEEGHFIFGPLEGEWLYLVKVTKNSMRLRELEVVTD